MLWSCSCSSCWWKKSPNQKYSFIQSFPDELLRIILSYYATSSKDLLTFSFICHSWKVVADSSLHWITIPKSFYTTKKYFQSRSISVDLGETVEDDLIEYCQKHESSNVHTIFLFDPLNRNEEILIEETETYRKKDNPRYYAFGYKIVIKLYKKEVNSLEMNSYDLDHDTKAILLTQMHAKAEGGDNKELTVSEFALKIRNEYMKVFLEYHQLWARYSRFILFLDKIGKFDDKYKMQNTFHYFLTTLIFLITSIILLSNLSNMNEDHNASSSSLSLFSRHLFGFVCLDIFWILEVLYPSLIGATYSLLYDLRYPPDYNLLTGWAWNAISWNQVILWIYFVGIGLSLIVLECQILIKEYDSSVDFPIIYLSIPLFIFTFFAWLPRFLHDMTSTTREYLWIAQGILLLALPMSYLLVTLYYQNPHYLYSETIIIANRHQPGLLLWCATIPLLPGECFFLFLALNGIFEAIKYWRKYYNGVALYSGSKDEQYFLKQINLFCNIDPNYVCLFIVNVLLLLQLFLAVIIVYFNIALGMNTIDLSTVFIIFLLIFLVFHLTRGIQMLGIY